MVNPTDKQRDQQLWKQKDRQEVVVILKDNVRLYGTAHLIRNQRLLDLLNVPDQPFLPLTKVRMLDEQTGQELTTDFVAVNKSEILLLTSYSDEVQNALDGTRWGE